jgi:polysaccharide biosynthesis protein PslH
MKILNVIPYSPVPPTFGGALRVYHLLRWLARHHDVHVLMYGRGNAHRELEKTLGMPEYRIEMVRPPTWLNARLKRVGQVYALLRNTSFTEVVSRNALMQRALDRFLGKEKFQVIQIAYPSMGYFHFASDAVRVLDAANVEYDVHRRVAESSNSRLRRFWAGYEYRKLYPQELAICNNQDALLLTSQRDSDLLHKDIPTVAKYVIPNGVDTAYFRSTEESVLEDSIVFTGAINYFPNTDGVEYFITEVLPLIRKEIPEAKFYVVGQFPPESVRRLASEHVIVTGLVPDVRPFVQRAAVYVVPLRMGGGTRLKVLEALAMKRPVVTTSIGCEGIDVTNEDSVLVADDPQAFAEATIRLLKDRRLRQKLAARGCDVVRAKYDWEVIGGMLQSAYGDIVRNRKNGSHV